MAWKLHSKSGLDFGPEKCSGILKVPEVSLCARALSDRAGMHVVICSPPAVAVVSRATPSARDKRVQCVFSYHPVLSCAILCARMCNCAKQRSRFFGFRFGHILSIYRASWSSPPGPPFGGSETIPFITGTFVADVTTPVAK